MICRGTIILLFSLVLYLPSQAQYYDTGEDPAKLKWLQIKTEHFMVIYPENFGTEGVIYARSLEESHKVLSQHYDIKKYRIPVIIHNYTTFSNGYVAWAPRRMELYPTPEQNTIPGDPVKQLTLHELSHVMQMNTLNRGLTGAFSIFLGEQAPGAAASLLPLWYLEGEAVLNETMYSESGRGRSAAFQKQLKAIAVEKNKMYNYDKFLNGSYRDFVPDRYRYGYQLVAAAYRRFDPDIWNRVLKLTGNAPVLLNPVNISLLSGSKMTKQRLFNETVDTLASKWIREISEEGRQDYKTIIPVPDKKYINYSSPVKVDENSYAAVKTSLYTPPEFVLINNSDLTEKRIFVPGFIYPYHITSARRNLVWVENQPDPRWNNRDYSVIKRLDLRNMSVKQLTRKTRYLSAAISPDGKFIAATENTVNNKNNLVLLEPSTGKILKSFPTPDNAYLQRPQWSDDGTQIILISLSARGEGIISFNIKSESWSTLIDENWSDFQSVFYRNDSLFFVSSASGTENIYLKTPGNEHKMMTNSKYGATDVTLDNNMMIFSDYSVNGNKICTLDLASQRSFAEADPTRSYFQIDDIEKPAAADVSIPGNTYYPKPYRKLLHPVKLHSWMPFYADLETIQSDPLAIRPGFTILSQNNLSTVISTLGYEYSEKRHKLHSTLTWKGWYPVLESRIDYGGSPYIYKMGSGAGDPASVSPGIYFTNSVYVPLTYSNSKFSQHIRPSVTSVYQNNYVYMKEDSLYDYGQTMFSGRLYFSNYHRSVNRDIYPRIAQVFDLAFSFYPFDRKIYGNDIILRTAFYFPGFFRNNGIRLRYENETQVIEKLLTYNRVNLPRGYKNIISEDLKFVSVDYVAPLLYPDISIGRLLYLKRIRAGLFFDYAKGSGNYHLINADGRLVVDSFRDYAETFSSYGVELVSDFHVLRIPYQVSAGIQASWIRGEKSPALEMVFNIDIYGLSIGKQR